jgi:hypothetical protein
MFIEIRPPEFRTVTILVAGICPSAVCSAVAVIQIAVRYAVPSAQSVPLCARAVFQEKLTVVRTFTRITKYQEPL